MGVPVGSESDRVQARLIRGWKPQQAQPVSGSRVNSCPLVRTLARTLAALVDTHVVPQHEQVRVGLRRSAIPKSTAVVQEHLQKAVDSFDQATGVPGRIQDVHPATVAPRLWPHRLAVVETIGR